MNGAREELLTISDVLEQLADRGHQDNIQQPLERLKQAAEEVGRAWSGSWLGYQANVYYKGLQSPPPGAHFSTEWGFNARFARGTSGDWIEYDPADVTKAIHQLASNPDIEPARAFNAEASSEFRTQQRYLLSIIDVEMGSSNSSFLMQLKEEAGELSVRTEHNILQLLRPDQAIISRDRIATNQGYWTPPHFFVLSQVLAVQHTIGTITNLAELTKQLTSHTSRQRGQLQPRASIGTRVFIGHGQSPIWRELKDFIEDRLGLPVDEFNRVSTAGVPTTGRLSAMMETAAIGLLVMTGEDELSDGQLRARENVVHEAGLFQGRLGFERAIVLLEEGCKEFSNITGLGQIRFPRNNISSAFEEIRMVLEREGILSPDPPKR